MPKEDVLNKVFPVLDDGYVQLLDVMGDDMAIDYAARNTSGLSPEEKTRLPAEARGLIRYLMRHAHTTPVEMVEFKFKVRVPMDSWRQWIRHRMASVNEYSTRYSEAIDSAQKTDPEAWRKQATANRQGSSGEFVTTFPPDYRFTPLDPDDDDVVVVRCDATDDPNTGVTMTIAKAGISAGEYLSQRETEVQRAARSLYEERLKFGVAKEQARKDLPLSTYTEAIWKIDLHNLLHFLSLRMDTHAQFEIRQYATVIGKVVAEVCPWAWEAFNDYHPRRGAVLLTRLDALVINKVVEAGCVPVAPAGFYVLANSVVGWPIPPGKNRERDESLLRLQRLGLATY